MTKKQKEAMEEANVSPELMKQIEKYVNEKCRIPSASKKNTNHQEDELIDNVLSFLDEKSDATIDEIIEHCGSPETYEALALESDAAYALDTVKKRMNFRRIILIAAIIAVTIIGFVYAGALIIQNQDAPGTYDENLSVSYRFNINGDEGIE